MTNTSTEAETSQINSSSRSPSGPSGPVQRRGTKVNRFEGSGSGGRVQRNDLRIWSNRLHRTTPSDLYKHTKIPYKTILVSILFFIIGTIFLVMGIDDYREVGGFCSDSRPG